MTPPLLLISESAATQFLLLISESTATQFFGADFRIDRDIVFVADL